MNAVTHPSRHERVSSVQTKHFAPNKQASISANLIILGVFTLKIFIARRAVCMQNVIGIFTRQDAFYLQLNADKFTSELFSASMFIGGKCGLRAT